MRLSTITTELIRHVDGRPVGYIDATAVTIFAYQQRDGSYVIDICTRQHVPAGRLCLLLDGAPPPVLSPRLPTGQHSLAKAKRLLTLTSALAAPRILDGHEASSWLPEADRAGQSAQQNR